MGKFGVDFTAFATTTTPKTAVALVAAAGEIAELVEALMSGDGTTAPADRQHSAEVLYYDGLAVGTGTAATPVKMDPQGNVAKMTGTVEFSVEPTTYETVSPMRFGFNQRGGMRWAVPKGDGIIVTGNVAANDNIGMRVDSDAAGAVEGYFQFVEP